MAKVLPIIIYRFSNPSKYFAYLKNLNEEEMEDYIKELRKIDCRTLLGIVGNTVTIDISNHNFLYDKSKKIMQCEKCNLTLNDKLIREYKKKNTFTYEKEQIFTNA